MQPVALFKEGDDVKHFSDEEWLDFARGLMPGAEMNSMQRHLDEGCERCHRVSVIWKAVVSTLNQVSRYRVPEDVVRGAQSAYATWRWQQLLPQRARVACLVFDTGFEGLRAGVRSHARHARRLLHRMGPWMIDLSVEPEPGNRIYLAGQVLRSGRKLAKAAMIEIILVSAGTFVTRTSANKFGEFQLEYEKAKNLTIYVDIAGQLPIAVDLPESDGKDPA
jgi:hypothetical protein